MEKEDVTTTEEQKATMKDVCEKCGHHGVCKFEDSCQETLESLSKTLDEAGLSAFDPFAILIQCKGFCQVAPPEEKKE